MRRQDGASRLPDASRAGDSPWLPDSLPGPSSRTDAARAPLQRGPCGVGGGRRYPPASVRFPAFIQPLMPSDMTKTLAYPSFAASRAASWLECQLGLAQ
jgi:hypothetical protein